MESRVAELDVDTLDQEFLGVINGSLDLYLRDLSDSRRWHTIFRYIKYSTPLMYYFHLLTRGSTPAQSLLGASYEKFIPSRRILLFILAHLAPTILRIVNEELRNIRVQALINRIATLTELLSLANFCYFLSNGGPSDLARRILGIKTKCPESVTGQSNNANVNRELLGHCVANVIMVVKPLVETLIAIVKEKYITQEAAVVNSNGLIVCTKCGQVAVVPLVATTTKGQQKVYCNYCYYVVKQSTQFSSVTRLSFNNKQ